MGPGTVTPRGKLWIYAVLPALVLNIGAIVLFGTYYALLATRPSAVANLSSSEVQFYAYVLVFAVEWVFALLLIRQTASGGKHLRTLIAPGGQIWAFRKLPAVVIFLVFNAALAGYVLITSAVHGGWPRFPELVAWQRAFMLLALPITAAFCEELIWRGHLIPQLEARGRTQAAAILLSAISFACIHGVFFPDKLLLTFVLGVAAGVYYVKERNLIPLMVSHWVADVWTFALSVL
jgi:membrane protease YdiL (CAAX protease family)